MQELVLANAEVIQKLKTAEASLRIKQDTIDRLTILENQYRNTIDQLNRDKKQMQDSAGDLEDKFTKAKQANIDNIAEATRYNTQLGQATAAMEAMKINYEGQITALQIKQKSLQSKNRYIDSLPVTHWLKIWPMLLLN